MSETIKFRTLDIRAALCSDMNLRAALCSDMRYADKKLFPVRGIMHINKLPTRNQARDIKKYLSGKVIIHHGRWNVIFIEVAKIRSVRARRKAWMYRCPPNGTSYEVQFLAPYVTFVEFA